ncbi:MAG: hypothetical protein EXX96DRAFT_35244 [Benjaminiella poitrasii]|nr:MAG: hypothetical protein EXX96DRAFT_35244 [Benjaminiella poitrasii]
MLKKRIFILILSSLFTLTIASIHNKRIPPFGSTSSSKRLGDYTHSHERVDKSTYSCFPIGECEPCFPLEKKTQPYCVEFGNKQAVHCEWDDAELLSRNQTAFDDDDAITLPSYRSCSRVKSVERVSWRQKIIAREQYQRLAQRIGVTVV